LLAEGLTLAEKAGDEIMGNRLLNSVGWLLAECGDLEPALDFNRLGAESSRQRRDPETIGNAELHLADIHLLCGDLSPASELLEGVHHLARDPKTSEWMGWRYSTHLFASLGELWLARGKPVQADEHAARCLDLAIRTGSRKYVVRGERLRGEIGAVRGQWEEAEEALRRALGAADSREPDRGVEDPPRARASPFGVRAAGARDRLLPLGRER
jgi:tetratricopeptide (TPR) repeat protein